MESHTLWNWRVSEAGETVRHEFGLRLAPHWGTTPGTTQAPARGLVGSAALGIACCLSALPDSAMKRSPAIRIPSGRVRRSARRIGPAAVLFAGLVCALSVFPAGRAETYSFSGYGGNAQLTPWKVEIWGPGRTMYVPLVRAGWEEWIERARADPSIDWFADMEDIRRALQWALDAWANIPTADIRWELAGFISEEQGKDTATFPLAFVTGSRFLSGAAVSTAEDGITDCRVRIHPGEGNSRRRFLYVAVHELGHCLGLDHPDVLVHRRHDYTLPFASRLRPYPTYWRADPLMSYGWYAESVEDFVTPDDAIGASLLRPREGWLASTGSIVGRVTLPEGEGVPWASVLATRLEPESEAYSVVVFSQPSGDFEIRGLVPGAYQLLVRSPTGLGNDGFFDSRSGAVLDLRQALRAGAVRVRAGEVSGPVPLAVRRSEPLP